MGRGLLFPGLRPRRPPRSVRRELRELRSRARPRARATMPIAATTTFPFPAVRWASPAAPTCSIAIAATAHSRMCRRRPASRGPRGPSSMVFVGSNWRPTGSYGMGAAAADFDNDGWPDIYVACDTAPSLLYRNNHDGTFREVGGPGRAARSTRTASRWRAWASASAITTATAGSTSSARTSPSRSPRCTGTTAAGAFEDASIRAGLGVNRKYVGFGVELLRLRQRRLEGYLHRQRPRVFAARRAQAAPHLPAAERALPQSGQRPLRGRVGERGDGHHVAESRSRLRLRRFRQRRRRRCGRQQPGRPADPVAQRWREQRTTGS